MGLIISVLVTCVGVYTVIRIYCDKVEKTGQSTWKSGGVSVDGVSHDRLSLSFHEKVEFECTSKILNATHSKRFLVTENDQDTSSLRKFIVSVDDGCNPNLREFFIAKGTLKKDVGSEIIVLIDKKEEFNKELLFPLPKQFIITQTPITRENLRNVKQGIVVDVNSLSLKGNEVENLSWFTGDIQSLLGDFPFVSTNVSSSTLHTKDNPTGTLSNGCHALPDVNLKVNEPEEFHREPSPYPSLLVPQHSVAVNPCSFDTTTVSVAEVDEDPEFLSKIDAILVTRNFDKTEYWSNKILVEPPKKFKSRSHSLKHERALSTEELKTEQQLVDKIEEVASSSISDLDHRERRISDLDKEQNEEFKDSLDGIKRNGAYRSFRKRKSRSHSSLENEEGSEKVDAANSSSDNATVNTVEMC